MIQRLPEPLRRRFQPFFARMTPPTLSGHRPVEPATPLPPPPSIRVLPAWMQRGQFQSEPSTSRAQPSSASAPTRRREEEDEDVENQPPPPTPSGQAVRHTRPNILRPGQRQQQQQQHQQPLRRPLQRLQEGGEEEEAEDVFAFPPRPTRPAPLDMTIHNVSLY